MNTRSIFGCWLAGVLLLCSACGDDDGDNNGGNGSGGNPSTGGSPATGGSPSTGGSPGTGGDGGAGPEVNGCTRASADDMTGQATVDLTWTLPHQQCFVIDAGTAVTWTGDFVLHPLAGGVTGTPDDGSPITGTDQAGASTSVTFDTAGDYPYYCQVHLGQMQGVIYVE